MIIISQREKRMVGASYIEMIEPASELCVKGAFSPKHYVEPALTV